jgi:uncharacterized protein (TIGR02646 family)
MRFVDISPLEFPNDWQAKANKALNDLRAEIAKAEADALAEGKDIAAARKAAITDGLASRSHVWQELAPYLAKLLNKKCWYSESLNPSADKNVDHFRPKNRILEDPSHDGYWWLAFDWRNFRYSSQWSNQRRIDRRSQTAGGKRDHFPLLDGCSRAMLEADDIDAELPTLLDPTDPDDWKLLTFRPDGRTTAAANDGTNHERAMVSIEVYHLDSKELVDDRRFLAGRIQRLVQDLERLRPRIGDLSIRRVYKNHQMELLRAIQIGAEYSSAALAYARAEIYKLEQGHQAKRVWLEEMLS